MPDDLSFLQERIPTWDWWPRRLTVSRWRAAVAVLLVCFAVTVAGFALQRHRDNQHEAERVQGNVAQCLRDNHDNALARERYDSIDEAIKAGIGVLATLSAGRPAPEQQAIAAFQKAYDDAVDAQIAAAEATIIDRKCDPASIDRYLSTSTTRDP